MPRTNSRVKKGSSLRCGQRHFLNSSNGHLGPYNFHRKLKDTKTVNDWKKERFEPTYLKQQREGFLIEVFRKMKGGLAIAFIRVISITIGASFRFHGCQAYR